MSVEYAPDPVVVDRRTSRPAYDLVVDAGPGIRMLHVRDEDERAEWGRWLWEHHHRIVYEDAAVEMVGKTEEIMSVALRITAHTIESDDPLTISPSLLCSCGLHGFVTDGSWVSA